MTKNCTIFYPKGMKRAFFLKRQKRFTVFAETFSGEPISAHTNNTGSMMGLLRPGREILLSPALNPGRKLKWTLEAVRLHDTWVGVNTSTPNRMIKAAWEVGAIPEATSFDHFRSEAKVGESRLDAFLSGPGGELWVECKNVTLVEDEVASFPDAITERGQKHLRELMDLASQGVRVALFFLVQRTDGRCFGPADYIDPTYAELFYRALERGVEVWPHVAVVDESGIRLGERLEVVRP